MNWRGGDRYLTDDGTLVTLAQTDDTGICALALDGAPHLFTPEGRSRCSTPCTHGHLAQRLTGTIRDPGAAQ